MVQNKMRANTCCTPCVKKVRATERTIQMHSQFCIVRLVALVCLHTGPGNICSKIIMLQDIVKELCVSKHVLFFKLLFLSSKLPQF